MPRPRPIQDEGGQALVEFALILPVLLAIFGGVLYMGAMAIAKQNLAVSARHVARQASISIVKQGHTAAGAAGAPDQSAMSAALRDSMPAKEQVTLSGVEWGALKRSGRGSYRWNDKLGGNVAELTYETTLRIHTADGKTTPYRAGIGLLYAGATVTRPLKELGPLARGLTKIATPGVSVTSVMPAELAPHGNGRAEGLLELNRWISDNVNSPTEKFPGNIKH
jgi:Flp pilus assembly protein TadG